MRRKNEESGRSMLEMIAVLIIIGLLTMGGLTGYNYLVQRYRRQETVKEIAELVLGVKTAALARRHEDGVTIAAREVVQGPKMNPSGEVIKLPEGENSYAVVTNLTGGAFAVNLQLEKGTCQAVLEALKNEDITMFMPSDKVVREGTMASVAQEWANGSKTVELAGVKYNVTETEEDKKLVDSAKGAELRKRIMAACEGDDNDRGIGRAAWVFDCSKGSSSYGYLYQLFCTGCPIGTMKDTQGACCSYTSQARCGNLCSCPEGTMCDPEKQQCVECTTVPTQEIGNAACQNLYRGVWQRHVCDGDVNRCVECLTDKDCCDSRAGYGNPKASESAKYCVSQHCVECNANYNGTTIATQCSTATRTTDIVHCPTMAKPLCQNGTCRECPEGQQWRDGECQCPEGLVKNSAGECVICVDDAYDHGTDTGCGRGPFVGKPICSTEEKVNTFGVGGTGNSGTTCVECIIDANCAHNPTKKYCSDNFVCVECDGAWDSENRVCRHCRDDNSGDLKDRGCEEGALASAKRLCKPDGSNDNGTRLFGDVCKLCRNNNYGNNNGVKDEGCSDALKLCDADAGMYGDTCKFCQNDREGATKDSGCDESGKPMCDAGNGAFGTVCHKCINDKSGHAVDTGCSDDLPMCQANSGAYGDECRNCPPETPVWSEKAGRCVACQDSVSGKETDEGCSASTPICVTASNKNDGTKDAGDRCAVCHDVSQNAGLDTNCTDEKPMCTDMVSGHFGRLCKSCREVDATKPEMRNGVCATCFDTATSTTQDQGCGAGTWAGKPMCGNTANNGQGSAGTACYKCYDSANGDAQDAGCPADTPVCVTENGKYGNTCEKPCSGDNKCIDHANRSGQGVDACINVNSFIDIKRGSNGRCECYNQLVSDQVNDDQNSWDTACGKKDSDWEKPNKRLTSSRERLYKVPSTPANFYCEYYFEAHGTADDYVVSGQSDGISSGGKNGTHDTWKERHDNSIAHKRATHTVKGANQQKQLVVSDRWLCEVGYKGKFHFVLASAPNGVAHSGSKSGINVSKGWNSGSNACNRVGKWRDKD